MSWSTNTKPKKEGWYLVTIKGDYVMPAYRMEYPPGNFTWKEIHSPEDIIAVMKFPNPYKGEPVNG